MRYILLNSAPRALHQEAFGAWLNQPAHLDTDMTVGEYLHTHNGILTPYQATWHRDTDLGFGGREALNMLQPLNQSVDLLDWLRGRTETMAQPILYIREEVNWTQDRRRYLPVLEEILTDWGLEHELPRVSLASNWTKKPLEVYGPATRLTPFVTQATVSTTYTYNVYKRYYKAFKEVVA